MRSLLAFALVTCVSPANADDPWHTDLFLPGHDTWRARVALDLTNTSTGDLAGFPVTVPVGEGEGDVPLVGADAKGVRVCDTAGVEMLFDLRAPDGNRVETGATPPDSVLTVPLTAAAGQTQRLYVYSRNRDAYRLPEYLQGRMEVANPGFERGAGDLPDDWWSASGDPQHRATWLAEGAHTGERCVRVTVDADAEPQWVTVQQRDLAVLAGRRYRLTAWVRGGGVEGRAGWYVHVATPENAQAVNRVESAGDGSFDWREVVIEFETPEDATSLSHGTVLYGTGTAWFDDARLDCLEPGGSATVVVGAAEHLDLRTIAPPAAFLKQGDFVWRHRAAVYVVNVGEPLEDVLVRVRAARLVPLFQRGFSRESLRVADADGRQLPHTLLGEELLFRADVPAGAIGLFYVYLDRRAPAGGSQAMSYDELVQSTVNLAANPSFEAGGDRPDGWQAMGEGVDRPTATLERVPGGQLGEHCVRMYVAPDEPERWTGWQQDLTAEPNAEYVLMAYARTEGVTDGNVRLHAHLRREAGGPTLQFWSAGPDLTGTTDWTLLGRTLQTTHETHALSLFLTMNAKGTAYHDGVLFARTVPATMGELEHLTPPDAPPLQVWTENPMVKVFRDTPPERTPERIELAVARGEEESIQLCLHAREETPVQVEVSAPRAGDAELPPPRIEEVGFVPCLQPSGFFASNAPAWERKKPPNQERSDGWRGWWPDYLTPAGGTIDLSPDTTAPLWITFRIPRDARPGVYRSAIRVTSPQRTVEVPVTLRVLAFQLPARPTLTALFDLRNGPGWSLYDTPEKLHAWWRFMAQHRICTDHILPPPVFRLVEGRVLMDATEFNRAAAFCFDELYMASAYFPEVFYAFGWGHTPRPFLGLQYPSAEYQDAYRQGVQLFWDHVQERGWADRFSLYISDEPHYEQRPQVIEDLANVMRLVREVDPAIPVYSSTWGHCPEWDGILNHWGIAQYGKFPLDVLRERQEAGDKVWFTTDGQFVLDTPYNACERLLPYYCFAYDVTGYEFWALPWYTYDPYRFGWHAYLFHSFAADETNYTRYPNGSGHLAYPGEPLALAGPISSIRLEQVREGLEDYEVLAALQKLAQRRPALRDRIDPVLADAKALAPIPNAGGYRSTEIMPDPDAVLRVRAKAMRVLAEYASD